MNSKAQMEVIILIGVFIAVISYGIYSVVQINDQQGVDANQLDANQNNNSLNQIISPNNNTLLTPNNNSNNQASTPTGQSNGSSSSSQGSNPEAEEDNSPGHDSSNSDNDLADLPNELPEGNSDSIVCGNGFCETGESCSSCPSDCGACVTSCTESQLGGITFTPNGGIVASGTTVALSYSGACSNYNIYYTIDNTTPTATTVSSLYSPSTPIIITQNKNITARVSTLDSSGNRIYGVVSKQEYKINTTIVPPEINSLAEFTKFTEISGNSNFGEAVDIVSKPTDYSAGIKEFVVLYFTHRGSTSGPFRLVSFKYNLYSQTLIDKKIVTLNNLGSLSGYADKSLYYLSADKYIVVGTNKIIKIDFSKANPDVPVWEYNFATIIGEDPVFYNGFAGITTNLDVEGNFIFTGRLYPITPEVFLIKMNVNSDTAPTDIWSSTNPTSCGNPSPGYTHSCYSTFVKSQFVVSNNNLIYYYLNSNGLRIMSLNKLTGEIIWDVNKSYNASSLNNSLTLLDNGDLFLIDINQNKYVYSKLSKTDGSTIWQNSVLLSSTNPVMPILKTSGDNMFLFDGYSSSDYRAIKKYYNINLNNGTANEVAFPDGLTIFTGNSPYSRTKPIIEFNPNTNDVLLLHQGSHLSLYIDIYRPFTNIIKIDKSGIPYMLAWAQNGTKYFTQFGNLSYFRESLISNNALYIAGYSFPYENANTNIFLSKQNLVDSKTPVVDYYKTINLASLNYSLNKDLYWTGEESSAYPVPNMHFELLNDGYGILFVPNLMNKDTNAETALLTVINLNNEDNKNQFTLTAPETITPVPCTDAPEWANYYCITANLKLSESANIGMFVSDKNLSVLTSGNFIRISENSSPSDVARQWNLNEITSGDSIQKIRTNYTGAYYLNISSYSSADSGVDYYNPKIGKRQLHRIYVNAVN
ncbi:MAG: chitobiase/beta-hexosaminidase C-terminal domain-containing protein [archaeon]|jgi:hypothetical protein